MVHGANATSCADEATSNGIADPDAEPRLPPRQPIDDHATGDHPCVDVEGISNPEADEVPRTPLSTSGLDGLEIVVGQLHKGGGGSLRVSLDRLPV